MVLWYVETAEGFLRKKNIVAVPLLIHIFPITGIIKHDRLFYFFLYMFIEHTLSFQLHRLNLGLRSSMTILIINVYTLNMNKHAEL